MRPSTAPAETDRLLLLPWSEEYDDSFAALCADERAMEFITGGRPLPREVVDAINSRARAMWSEHGFGPWAILEKRTGLWLGRIGLNLLADWRPRELAPLSPSRGSTRLCSGSSASRFPTTLLRGA